MSLRGEVVHPDRERITKTRGTVREGSKKNVSPLVTHSQNTLIENVENNVANAKLEPGKLYCIYLYLESYLNIKQEFIQIKTINFSPISIR